MPTRLARKRRSTGRKLIGSRILGARKPFSAMPITTIDETTVSLSRKIRAKGVATRALPKPRMPWRRQATAMVITNRKASM